MSVMSDVQLKRLSEHKYSAQCTSLLDPVFQVWWRWLVEQMPLWLAPNVLTLLGFLANLIPNFILVFYLPQAYGTAPRWVYFACGLGVFVAQSLDAIDGKQARRTGSSSPLGELFDHGCDSIAMVTGCLSFAITIQLGREPIWMFIMCFTGIALFYVSHWQTYVSGTMKFGLIDVTELQVASIIIYFLTGTFGPSLWLKQAPFIGVTFQTCLIASSVLGCALSVGAIFSDIYQGGIGKNGSTIAGTSVLSPLLPITLTTYLAYQVAVSSPANVFIKYPCLFYLAHGFAATKVTLKLVVACMSKSPLEIKDACMLGGIIQVLNIHWGCPIQEKLLLYFMLVSQYSSEILISYPDLTMTHQPRPQGHPGDYTKWQSSVFRMALYTRLLTHYNFSLFSIFKIADALVMRNRGKCWFVT